MPWLLHIYFKIFNNKSGDKMSIISCSKKCQHQKDGVCILKNTIPVQTVNETCLYFKNETKNKVENKEKKNYFM